MDRLLADGEYRLRPDPLRGLSGRSWVRRHWRGEAARLEVDENVARELEPGPEPDGGRGARGSAPGEAPSAEDLARFEVENEPSPYVVMSMRAAEAAALEHQMVERARASEALHGPQGSMVADSHHGPAVGIVPRKIHGRRGV